MFPKLTSRRFLLQRLLAELQAVRASDHGVLDGESQGSSLRELDTDYERDGDLEADEDQARSRKKTKSRAAKADAAAAKTGKSKSKGKGKGKGKVVEQDDTTATDEDSADAAAVPPPKKRSRKAARPDPVDAMEVDELVDLAYEEPVEYEAPLRDEYDTEDDEAPRVSSPKKRKVCSPRCRLAAVVQSLRRRIFLFRLPKAAQLRRASARSRRRLARDASLWEPEAATAISATTIRSNPAARTRLCVTPSDAR